MTHKKAKRIVTLTGIVAAAALSLTSKPNFDIPKDRYYDKLAPTITLLRDNSTEFLAHYHDFLDNTKDTIALRNEDYKKLDSLMTEAKNILEVPFIIYNKERIDSIVDHKIDSLVTVAQNYQMVNKEALANSILDTITNFTEVVSKTYVNASIREESQYIDTIRSPAGAEGFMQFTKDGWKVFGEGPYNPNVKDPIKNIQAGIRYYRWMEVEFSKYHPNWDALTIGDKRNYLSTGFNGGPYSYLEDKENKINWNIHNMYRESINHANKINKSMVHLICKNIALYKGRIERYELEKNNIPWFALNHSL